MLPFRLILSFSLTLASLVCANVNVAQHDRSLQLSGRKAHGANARKMQKRDFNGQATYYAVGLGACGSYNVPSDYIVALNSAQYGSGEYCGKALVISFGGKTATAVVMDECPGCSWGSLDCSQGLFEHFADTSVGVFQMTWNWAGAAPAPTPTTTWKPAPTTTWVPPATTPTTTWQPATTSTPSSSTTASTSSISSSSSSSSSQSLSVSTSSSGTASAAASTGPVGGASPAGAASSGGNNIGMMNAVVVQYGNVISSGATK